MIQERLKRSNLIMLVVPVAVAGGAGPAAGDHLPAAPGADYAGSAYPGRAGRGRLCRPQALCGAVRRGSHCSAAGGGGGHQPVADPEPVCPYP